MQIREACTAVKYSHAGSHSALNWCIIGGKHSFPCQWAHWAWNEWRHLFQMMTNSTKGSEIIGRRRILSSKILTVMLEKKKKSLFFRWVRRRRCYVFLSVFFLVSSWSAEVIFSQGFAREAVELTASVQGNSSSGTRLSIKPKLMWLKYFELAFYTALYISVALLELMSGVQRAHTTHKRVERHRL